MNNITVAELLDWHLARYPLLGPADIYKLVHQSVYGPRHLSRGVGPRQCPAESGSADADVAVIYEELLKEAKRAGPPTQPLEPIDPSGLLIRVNLRPQAQSPERLQQLAIAVAETAGKVKGDPGLMASRLALAQEWCWRASSRLTQESELESAKGDCCHRFAELVAQAALVGYPVLHHTAVYRQAYSPAYRVVLAAYWQV